MFPPYSRLSSLGKFFSNLARYTLEQHPHVLNYQFHISMPRSQPQKGGVGVVGDTLTKPKVRILPSRPPLIRAR